MRHLTKFFFGIAIVLLHPQFVETVFWTPTVLSEDFPVVIGYLLLLSAASLLPGKTGWRVTLYAGTLVGLAAVPYWIMSRDGSWWFPTALSMLGLLLQILTALQLCRHRSALAGDAAGGDTLLKTGCLIYAAAGVAILAKAALTWLLQGSIPFWLESLQAACCLLKLLAGCCILVRLFAHFSKTEAA